VKILVETDRIMATIQMKLDALRREPET